MKNHWVRQRRLKQLEFSLVFSLEYLDETGVAIALGNKSFSISNDMVSYRGSNYVDFCGMISWTPDKDCIIHSIWIEGKIENNLVLYGNVTANVATDFPRRIVANVEVKTNFDNFRDNFRFIFPSGF